MADIKVNKEQWESVAPEEQTKITEGLRSTGIIRDEDFIVGDESVVEFDKDTEFAPLSNPIKELCKAGCDIAAGSAIAWCTANTVGVGLAACLAAAEVARNECKKRC